MRTPLSATLAIVAVGGLAVALTASGPARAAAIASASASASRPAASILSDSLDAIAVTSPRAIWAGGAWHDSADREQTLVQRWNGTAWKLAPSPNPAGAHADNELIGLAAASRSSAWGVGTYWNGTNWQTMTQRWNGMAWKRTPSQDPAGPSGRNILQGVAATAPSRAWAVGYYDGKSGNGRTMVLRWNGKSWARVASPSPGGTDGSALAAVTAISSSNAWAVGDYFVGTQVRTLIEHWNGKAWKQVASPNPGGSHGSELLAVAAYSSSDIWAVGNYGNGKNHGNAELTLIEHWNGRTWKWLPSPSPGGTTLYNALYGVSAVGPSDAWAVGYIFSPLASTSLIEHWNGKTWKQVAGPNLGKGGRLYAIAAVSRASIWAVGTYYPTNSAAKNLIEHWNGASWQQVPSPNR